MNLSQITHITIIAVFAVVVSGAVHADNTCYSAIANGVSVDTTGNSWISSSYNEVDFTWVQHYSFGDVSGIAQCSTTAGTYGGTASSISTTPGDSCWCKMLSPTESSWVFVGEYAPEDDVVCSEDCMIWCGVDFSLLEFVLDSV